MMAYFSSGTEGMAYQEAYCDKCANEDSDGMCAVWLAHLLYSGTKEGKAEEILNILIPTGDDGFATQCAMFREAK